MPFQVRTRSQLGLVSYQIICSTSPKRHTHQDKILTDGLADLGIFLKVFIDRSDIELVWMCIIYVTDSIRDSFYEKSSSISLHNSLKYFS